MKRTGVGVALVLFTVLAACGGGARATRAPTAATAAVAGGGSGTLTELQHGDRAGGEHDATGLIGKAVTYMTQEATVDLIASLAAADGSPMPPPAVFGTGTLSDPPAEAPSDGDTVVVASTSGGVSFTFTAAKVTEIYVGAGAE